MSHITCINTLCPIKCFIHNNLWPPLKRNVWEEIYKHIEFARWIVFPFLLSSALIVYVQISVQLVQHL